MKFKFIEGFVHNKPTYKLVGSAPAE